MCLNCKVFSICLQQIIMKSEYSLSGRRMLNFINISPQETGHLTPAILTVICFFCIYDTFLVFHEFPLKLL